MSFIVRWSGPTSLPPRCSSGSPCSAPCWRCAATRTCGSRHSSVGAGPVLRQQIETAILLVVAAFVLLIIYPAIEYAIDEAIVRTPGLDISNSWRASAVAAGAILIAVFSFLRLAVVAPSLRFLIVSVSARRARLPRALVRAPAVHESRQLESRDLLHPRRRRFWSRPAYRSLLRSASRPSATWRSRRARR